jgi:small subunit ribosomal protein S18
MRSKPQSKSKAKEKKKRLRKMTERGPCRWCRTEKVAEKKPDVVVIPIEYKNVDLAQRFVTAQGKIYSRKRSGSCGRHQRALKMAVKHARYLALIPYVG